MAFWKKPPGRSHAEATHESSKAESKYDTRGLEAAYLAGGQARQAMEILDSIKLYETLTTKNFAADEPIDLTALVELDVGGARSRYFIGPKNGGLEIEPPAEGDHRDYTSVSSGSNSGGQASGSALDSQAGRFGCKIPHYFGRVNIIELQGPE